MHALNMPFLYVRVRMCFMICENKEKFLNGVWQKQIPFAERKFNVHYCSDCEKPFLLWIFDVLKKQCYWCYMLPFMAAYILCTVCVSWLRIFHVQYACLGCVYFMYSKRVLAAYISCPVCVSWLRIFHVQ